MVSINSNTEVIEENNYYPFGLKHKGYNNVVSSNANSVASRFKFGGKELNDELGLDWYDIIARNYDAALGRWFVIDPLAEVTYSQSTYHYANNNPIYFIDPNGLTGIGYYDYYNDGAGNVVYDPNINSQEDVDALGLDGASYIGDDFYDSETGTYYDKNGKEHRNQWYSNGYHGFSWWKWLSNLDFEGNATYTVGSGFVLIGKGGSGRETNTTSENPGDDIYIPGEVIAALKGITGGLKGNPKNLAVHFKNVKSIISKGKRFNESDLNVSHLIYTKDSRSNSGSDSTLENKAEKIDMITLSIVGEDTKVSIDSTGRISTTKRKDSTVKNTSGNIIRADAISNARLGKKIDSVKNNQ